MNQSAIYTVSQVNRYLKRILINDMTLQDLRVVGEISNFKHHKPSGHMYFTLKEEDNVLRAVFFRGKNQHLNFLPAEGMKVVARGSTSIYERSGYFQLYVEKLEPEGQGELYQAFEQLKAELQKQGLFDTAYKKPLPYISWKVGVITSPTGAAIRDFLTTLERRFPHLHVVICPVAVQGKDSPFQITSALRRMDSGEEFDVLVLTRGGGSLEELWSFNNEEVARTIFQARTPVVSAVGHETDFSIADFVADCRASTPTAAAELITPDRFELEQKISIMETRLQSSIKNIMSRRWNTLNYSSSTRYIRFLQDRLNYQAQKVDELWQRLIRDIHYDLKMNRSILKSLEGRMNTLNPKNVMERGFTIVVDSDKNILKSIQQVQEGQDVNVIFKDGKVSCHVENVYQGKPGEEKTGKEGSY